MSESINWMSLVYSVAVLMLLLPAAFYVFTRPSALRNVALWVALFAALVWGYHYMVEIPQMQAGEHSALPNDTPQGTSPSTPRENDSPVRNL